MKTDIIVTPLKELLQPIIRQESVEADQTYNILGAHWYADGLYTKETKPGVGIQADKIYRVEEGDFVYNRLFAWKGSFAIASSGNHNCYVSNEFPTFKINLDKIDPTYLWRYFSRQTAWSEALGLSSGGTPTSRNRLKEEKLLAMEIPLPPLEEQRRIVARIEELAAKIEEARELRREAVEEVSNVLAAFITHIFSGEKASFWQEGQLGDYILDDCYGTSEKTLDDPTGIPILRMGNIQNGRILTTELKYLYLDDRNRDKQILKKGDILVNRTNSAELVGKCAVFDLKGDYGFASYIIRLRIDQAKANPWLIAAYINSPLGRKYIFQERTQMTGQANINAKKLKALPIKLPSSIEQQQIVEAMDYLQRTIDGLKQQQTQTSAELNALLPSILDKAFKGEL